MSGLLSAYYLKRAGYSVSLFESSQRVGGWVRTETIGGRTIEWGPQTIMANRAWRLLIEELNLVAEEPPQSGRTRYIWFQNRRERLPLGLIDFFRTPLLSSRAKWRVLSEAFRSTSISESDLTLAEFFERVFHTDLVDNLLDPFVGGIYAGDVRKLSASSCFPRVWDAVKDHRSVIRGLIKNRTGDRPKILSFKHGLGEFVSALQKNLNESICLGAKVERLARLHAGWRVESSIKSEVYDQVILALPATESAALLEEVLSQNQLRVLKSIFYQRVGVWTTVFDRPQNFETGFGILVPRAARESLLGSLWGSEMFRSRCDSNEIITTQFFSGETVPRDPEIHLPFLKKILTIDSKPKWQEFRIHEKAIPQFSLHHRSTVLELRNRLPQGIYLTGHYLDGVGLTHVMNTVIDVVKSIKNLSAGVSRAA